MTHLSASGRPGRPVTAAMSMLSDTLVGANKLPIPLVSWGLMGVSCGPPRNDPVGSPVVPDSPSLNVRTSVVAWLVWGVVAGLVGLVCGGSGLVWEVFGNVLEGCFGVLPGSFGPQIHRWGVLGFLAPRRGVNHSRAGGSPYRPPLRGTPQRVPPGPLGPNSKAQKLSFLLYQDQYSGSFRHQ